MRYTYGEDPWTPYGTGYNVTDVLKVFDVGEKKREALQSEIDVVEWERWRVMERVGLDAVWKVGQGLLETGPQDGEQPAD